MGDGLGIDVTDGEGVGVGEDSGVDAGVGVIVTNDVGAGVGVVGVSTGYVPRLRDRGVGDDGGPILARMASADPLRSLVPGVVVLFIFTQT